MPENLTPAPHPRAVPVVIYDPAGTATSEVVSAFYRVAISGATNGDNTLVAAAGAGVKIRVYAMAVIASGSATFRLESGAGGTALTGAMSLANNVGFVLPPNEHGWVETVANQALNMELNAAQQVSGMLVYQLVS